jgi:hypothetical protein
LTKRFLISGSSSAVSQNGNILIDGQRSTTDSADHRYLVSRILAVSHQRFFMISGFSKQKYFDQWSAVNR